MLAVAHIRNLRSTPKKMNLVAGMVRGMSVSRALATLALMPKKAAQSLAKAIASAAANAEIKKLEKKSLKLESIIVHKGMTLKRGMPISRGQSHPILKVNSHVYVTVSGHERKAESATAVAVKAEAELNKKEKVISNKDGTSSEAPRKSLHELKHLDHDLKSVAPSHVTNRQPSKSRGRG